RGIEIDDVDDVKPGKLLLRVGVGAVQHPGRAVRDSHSPRRRGRLEADRARQDARLLHYLRICLRGFQPVLLLGLRQLGPAGLPHVMQEDVFHWVSRNSSYAFKLVIASSTSARSWTKCASRFVARSRCSGKSTWMVLAISDVPLPDFMT